MIRTMLVAGAFGLAAICGTAHAQKLDYDCDTQAEHYSKLTSTQDGPTYSASGTISMRAMFAVKEYVTLGSFLFESADHSWTARLAMMGMMVDKKPVVMGSLLIKRGDKAEPEQMLGTMSDYEAAKVYPIKLTLGPDGGNATLGGTTVPVALKASGKVNVSVICSGGEFLFTDLDLSGR